MTILYDLIYAVLLALGWPLLVWRRMQRGPGSLAIGERLGIVPSRPVSARCAWIHGVSLGEINAARTLVDELRRRLPDTVIVFSATTQTGLDRARELFPRHTVFRFPIDFSFIVRRVLDHVRPSVIVLMELEAWPNLVEVAAARDIPVVIANGRITDDRSVRNFQRPVIRWVIRRMFSKITWIGAQDETYAERFVSVGARPERVHVVGSVKYDAAELVDRVAGQDALAEAMAIDRAKPLWVCGSTGPDEEALILTAYEQVTRLHPELQLALVPRKPERFEEVARLIVSRGYACLRRSGPPVVPAGGATPRPVFLGDTLGELRKFYALATVVLVGRSLVPLGGSDVMEVAGLAKPILIGPHTDNFAEAVRLLCGVNAAEIVPPDPEAIGEAVRRLLRDELRRKAMGQAGRRVIESRRGATHRTVDAIIGYLE